MESKTGPEQQDQLPVNQTVKKTVKKSIKKSKMGVRTRAQAKTGTVIQFNTVKPFLNLNNPQRNPNNCQTSSTS